MDEETNISGTEYFDLIHEVARANAGAYDRRIRAEAYLETAAENAEPTDVAIRAAIRDEMAEICRIWPAPYDQAISEEWPNGDRH
ncbi:MAG: hypothetical protein KDA93_27695 [Planctomycetaceae bacterium]|nr:hypothetical protein [Planctomycetaceae bacterium]